MKLKILLLLLILLSGKITIAQDSIKSSTQTDSAFWASQVDLKEVIRNLFSSKKDFDTIKIIQTERDFTLSILPGISYNPATDVVFGIALSASWFNGPKSTTTNSSFVSSVSYTTKQQFKLSVQNNAFYKNDAWNFQGDWRLWNYVQDTYGLGTNTPDSNAENMTFRFIRFNQNALKKISGRFFAGIGYSLEYYSKVSTINDTGIAYYPNFNNDFSRLHNYDSVSYLSSGFVINAAVDTRDNTVNPYRGVVLQANYYNYNEIFGSSQNWQKMYLEARAYHNLRSDRNPYILAFWFIGDLGLSGKAPYMSLPSIGWDKYNATGRGYIQGRFRGTSMLYGEFSNRINLSKNGLFGLVIFANVNTFSDSDTGQSLFDYLNPAAGIGIRIKFDSKSRTNIGVDYARGKYNSSGVFLTLGEFF